MTAVDPATIQPMPDNPLDKEWLIERLAAEVCTNTKGADRINAIKLLEQIRQTANPFSDNMSLEQRIALLKTLLTPDDIVAVVTAMPQRDRDYIITNINGGK